MTLIYRHKSPQYSLFSIFSLMEQFFLCMIIGLKLFFKILAAFFRIALELAGVLVVLILSVIL